MPTLKLSVESDVAELIVPSLPYARRLETAMAVAFDFTVATGGGPVTVPFAPIATIQTIILRSSQTITVTQNGQTVTLNANGILVLSDTSVTSLTVTNSSGSTARIDGACLGA